MKEGFSLPQEFLHRLKKIYPGDYDKIINTFNSKKTPAFRVNYLKADLDNLRKSLISEKINFEELTYPQGVFLLKTPLAIFQNKEFYKKGLVFVQNLSSMLPVSILSPQEGEKILDLCAAPGAKTTQIASAAKNSEIIAIEKVRKRYYKLLANLKTQAADSVKVLLIDGIWVRKKFPEYFDKILLDAPCSAEGRFLTTNPKSFKYWSQRKIQEMAHKQKKLLHAAFFALKEEGELVYSTCTFSPEENEVMINWFINKFKGKVEILPLDIPLDNVRPGFVRWRDNKFSSSLRLTKRILPDSFKEGFYIAKLKKLSV